MPDEFLYWSAGALWSRGPCELVAKTGLYFALWRQQIGENAIDEAEKILATD